MSALSKRPWLTWTPPVLVALVVIVVLQLGGSNGGTSSAGSSGVASANRGSSTAEGPLPTVGQGAGPGSTPTTGFAERLPTLPSEPFDYGIVLPAHAEASIAGLPSHRPLSELDTAVDASGEPITDEGATLGRVLFYDVNLSSNRTVRCASCHAQANSFTDPLTLSQGVGGIRTRRNSMGLANARFNPTGRFLWDEAAATLEIQVLMPFIDQREMALTEEVLVRRIEERPFYGPLFADAFGDEVVTPDRISNALAQFIRAMVSIDSPYDEGRAEVDSPLDPFPNFTDEQNEGKRLFFTPVAEGGGSCSSCHASEVQVTSTSGLKNNGLDPPTRRGAALDLGAFEITGDPADIGTFRVPSLRNIEVTAPYMHDGRLTSLESVIDHYREGINAHENLSLELRAADGTPVRMGFDDDQADALVAFLKTLTDRTFLTDERFSEPFRAP